MRRTPGTSGSTPSLGVVLVALLAIAVVGGTVLGYSRWQDDIDAATAIDPSPTRDRADVDGPRLPIAPSSADDEPAEPAYEPPTFEVLEPTSNRPQPVVLLVGDGYAAGDGASSAGTSFASLLARDLGWDVRLAADGGAGYVSPAPTLLDLLLATPSSLDPDLVVVQGGYGSNLGNDVARTAVEQLVATLAERYFDTPVVAVTPFTPDGATPQSETRERIIARSWRDDPDALLLRPQPEGWSEVARSDEGHERIATELVDAFRSAGLAPAAG